jgi:hypothetical protein
MRRIRARPAQIRRPTQAWLGRSGKSPSDLDRTAQHRLPPQPACARERRERRLGFAGGGAHRGVAGQSRHDAGVAIGGGGDSEVASARMHEGGRRAGGLGRDGLG